MERGQYNDSFIYLSPQEVYIKKGNPFSFDARQQYLKVIQEAMDKLYHYSLNEQFLYIICRKRSKRIA